MRINLGETVCDQDKNCYTDGVLVSAPLTSTPGQVGNVDPDSPFKVLSDNALPISLGIIIFFLLDTIGPSGGGGGNRAGGGGKRR